MDTTDKWIWMMDYCKKHGLPPAQTWAWDRAKKPLMNTKLEKVMHEYKWYEELFCMLLAAVNPDGLIAYMRDLEAGEREECND